MKKLKIPKLHGFVWVESFNGKKNEEEDRAKIYDENGEYIDYICLDGVDKKQYKNELKALVKAKDFEEFADLLGVCRYDYSESLEYLMSSLYDNTTQEEFDNMEAERETLKEIDFLQKYAINRIGNTYFYIE